VEWSYSSTPAEVIPSAEPMWRVWPVGGRNEGDCNVTHPCRKPPAQRTPGCLIGA